MFVNIATPIIQPRLYFFDQYGKPLVGGKVYASKVGTDEFKPTYRNADLTALNQNPIVLDQAGSALVYLVGSAQLRVIDKNGKFTEERIVHQQKQIAQFFDQYGKPLAHGKVLTCDYQSTLKKQSYQLDNLANSNPVQLDAQGCAEVSIGGPYRLRSFDKTGVMIADQDFKRPPIRVLTSRIYPAYFDESMSTSLDDLQSQQRTIGNESTLNEGIATQFALSSVMMRDVFNVITPEPECIATQFALNTAYQRTLLIGTTVAPESISTRFSINVVYQKRLLISNTALPESIATQFALVGVKIIN